MAFNLMYEHQFEIQTGTDETTEEAIFSPLAAGISSAEPANNEELAQDRYLDGAGFGETDVIGAQLVVSFSGHRLYGDEAQDYIFERLLLLGENRRTAFRWTEPNGDMFEGNCTIANIEGPGGDAGAKGEISFEIHFNGEVTYTPAGNDDGGGVEG